MNSATILYDELIKPVEKQMMRTVSRIVQDPDDAADALQNALAYIWKHLERIHHHANPHGYILRVCVSASYDVLRERSRRPVCESIGEGETAGAGSYGAPAVMERDAVRSIRQAVSALPRNQAEAVLLRVFGEESFATISEALGCSEATARSHVSKGLARLRGLLSEMDPLLVQEAAS